MSEEEKQLLITDLCGRLPHGVIFLFGGKEYHLLENINYSKDDGFVLLNGLPFSDCKPYLRPMSSMTVYMLNDNFFEIVETVEKETFAYPTKKVWKLDDVRYMQWNMHGNKGTHWYAKVGNRDVVDSDGNMKWNTRAKAEDAARYFYRKF